MTDTEIASKVKEIICTILKVSQDAITEETAIGDLPQWDSLHHLQIITALEKNFNFRFTPDVMMELEDVSDLIAATTERASL
ncbi:MAG: acyl carrier protein [Succinivibrio sp.]|nr:acyl carrier protein [Succinivibrio sp.]